MTPSTVLTVGKTGTAYMSKLNGKNRDSTGRFRPGCAPGPGRPRRETEGTYLLAISEHVTLDVWSKIIARAVQDALKGVATARAWLTRYLVSDNPPSLMSLAAAEQAGLTIDDQI